VFLAPLTLRAMKTQILCGMVITGLLSGCAWTGHHTVFSKYKDQNVLTGGPTFGTTIASLPQSVQNTLKEKATALEVSHIHKANIDGKMVYQVKFLDSEKAPPMWIREDGTPVKWGSSM
jgi:hypothetical protein